MKKVLLGSLLIAGIGVVLSLFISNIPANAASLPLIALSLNEGSGTTAADSSGNGNTASLSNITVSDWVTSQSGHGTALNFDKIDNIADAGSAPMLDNLPALTASAWVYPKDTGMYGKGSLFAKAYANDGYGWNFGFSGVYAGRIRLLVDYSVTDLEVVASTEIPMNQWSHVAVTWDGSSDALNAKIYINGVEAAYVKRQSASGTRFDESPYSFKIGDGHSSYHSTWNGFIDDVRLYNQVLTGSEIQADMNTAVAQ